MFTKNAVKKNSNENSSPIIGSKDVKVENENEMLIGSSVQPSTFKLADGRILPLGDVVQEAFNREETSIEDWNTMPDIDREAAIKDVVDDLDLADEDEQNQGTAAGTDNKESAIGEFVFNFRDRFKIGIPQVISTLSIAHVGKEFEAEILKLFDSASQEV